MFYSAKENAFYADELRSIYEKAGSWPGDSIEVDNSIFFEFSNEPPEGKYRVAGKDGLPAWVEIPPPTREEITAVNDAQKSALKAGADAEIAWRQDAVDAGIATDDETAALAEWKKYRVLLMRVDTTDPDWPTPPVTQAS
ncbi:tail fiber assembly protein [Kluyvera sp. CHPC 1.2972]|uniref:tail fiber assembly protein n=1 Tax=Kluyvera sp. CHPC 1.2972 TaxID=2995176 RepID=UPI003FA5B543